MSEKHQSEEITHLLHKRENKNCKAFISHLSLLETRFGYIKVVIHKSRGEYFFYGTEIWAGFGTVGSTEKN